MSDAQRERRVEELFALVVELSRAEREAFLVRHCGRDRRLRDELEALLAQDDEGTKDYLASPVLSPTTGTAPTEPGGVLPPGSLPERVGRYRLESRLGEGGMGAVYLAEQESPVRRQVALKIVKLGMDTEKVVARFERERQTLAMMDHPGIARILDGGSTESGRPYFVMEYVPGLPIHEFCDRERLDLRERLELFAEVCDAVQHAHQKGVVHRDIKPSNVLVSVRDGRAVPKVIDFGIARAVSSAGEGTRGHTRAHEVVGTRWYMSPEQAADASRVDTRTDIYALGVLLYQLLAGALPFDVEALAGRSAEELHEHLVEQDPPLPSARAARLPRIDEVARRRSTDRRGLVRGLSGDLDWISLKAMAREPSQRYPTASELAADLRRHLAYQPVLAGPPDLAYQLKKLVRRHRVVVLAGAGVFLALLVGLLATIWAAVEVAKQRDAEQEHARIASEAEQRALSEHADAVRAREAEGRLRAVAEEKALQARAATDFLIETISLADPEVALSPDVLRSMLGHAGEEVGTIFAEDPATEAQLRRAIGQAWHSLDEPELAEQHLRRAMDIHDSLDDSSLEELYVTALRLSKVQEDADSREASELGMQACRLATALISRELPEVGHDLLRALELAAFLQLESLSSFERLYAELERELPSGDPLWPIVADLWEFVGYQLGYSMDDSGGLPFLQRALEIRRRELDLRHPDIARTSGRLVHLLDQLGMHAEAEKLVVERIAIYEHSLPSDHWRLAEARSQLGACLSGQGRYAEAEELLLSSHRMILASRGPTNLATLDASWRLVRHFERIGEAERADVYRGQLAEALAFSRNAPGRQDRRLSAFGPEHAELRAVLVRFERMGEQAEREALGRDQRLARFGDLVREVVSARRASLPDDHPLAVLVGRMLAEYDLPQNAPIELRQLLVDEVLTTLDVHRERLPRQVAGAWEQLGTMAMEVGRPDQAEADYAQAWDVQVASLGRCSLPALAAERQVSTAQVWLGRNDLATARARESWCECVQTLGQNHEYSAFVLSELVLLAEVSDQLQSCEPYLVTHLIGRAAGDRNVQRLQRAAWLVARDSVYAPATDELAAASAERAAGLEPGSLACWNTLGAALLRCGRNVEAQEALERGVELRAGDDPIGLGLQALVAHALGLTDRAVELLACMDDVLSERPEDAWDASLPDALRIAQQARDALAASGPSTAQAVRSNSIAPSGSR